MLKWKSGAKYEVWSPGGAVMLSVLVGAARIYPVTITSGTDGVHSKTSRHYTGEAFDIRVKGLPGLTATALLQYLKQELPQTKFTALLENVGTPNVHIHLQVKKGTKFTLVDFLAHCAGD